MLNAFLNAITRRSTVTENGAVSHASTGSARLDYFTKADTYRDRKLSDVFADLSAAWAESPTDTLRIVFYHRIITRQLQGLLATERVQTGGGNRSEFRRALIWLARFRESALRQNLWLVPLVGTWKDLWHVEVIGELPRDAVYDLIEQGLHSAYDRAPLAKYLPKVRSRSNTHNDRHRALNAFARGLMARLGWTPRQYRAFKSTGRAHRFQTQMMRGEWGELAFAKLPGRALHQLVNHRGRDGKTTLERHGMEARYVEWVMDQAIAKFTGYPHELVRVVNERATLAQRLTVDRQFDGLIELARREREVRENVWCALDTSGSMAWGVAGDATAYDVCIGLGVYFSTLNRGAFRDYVVMFDRKSRVKQLRGSFSEKIEQIRKEATAWGNTDFQSVIDELVRVRLTSPEVPVEDFPTTLVVVSDMQFDPAGGNVATNYEVAMGKLAAVGLPRVRIVWWWVTGRGTDFPSALDEEGVIMIGGFDGAVLSLLLGEDVPAAAEASVPTDVAEAGAVLAQAPMAPAKATPMDAMYRALDQEVLRLVSYDG